MNLKFNITNIRLEYWYHSYEIRLTTDLERRRQKLVKTTISRKSSERNYISYFNSPNFKNLSEMMIVFAFNANVCRPTPTPDSKLKGKEKNIVEHICQYMFKFIKKKICFEYLLQPITYLFYKFYKAKRKKF